jgi:hypothetical protein
MLRQICIALIAAGAVGSASAERVVLMNVAGVTPTRTGMEEFSAMIIEDGRVTKLMAGPDIMYPKPATIIDGGRKYVLPGLTDAHGHVLGLGELKLQVDLRGTTSIDDALARIRKHIAGNPNARWVIGRGWNQVLWKEKRFPTALELDAAVADRPAVMTRVDGHATWVNTAALKVAGITASTKDPQGGQIVRDASGQATGVLVDTAEELIEKRIPEATDMEVKHQFEIFPSRSAASIIASATRSLIEPPGFWFSSLRKRRQLPASRRDTSTRGVLPMSCRMVAMPD